MTEEAKRLPSNKPRDSISFLDTSIFDTTNGDKLVQFIREKKGIRKRQPIFAFPEKEQQRSSFPIEVKPTETAPKENKISKPQPLKNVSNLVNFVQHNKEKSITITPILSPQILLRRLSEKNLTRRVLIQEFERTIPNEQFRPAAASTPLLANLDCNENTFLVSPIEATFDDKTVKSAKKTASKETSHHADTNHEQYNIKYTPAPATVNPKRSKVTQVYDESIEIDETLKSKNVSANRTLQTRSEPNKSSKKSSQKEQVTQTSFDLEINETNVGSSHQRPQSSPPKIDKSHISEHHISIPKTNKAGINRRSYIQSPEPQSPPLEQMPESREISKTYKDTISSIVKIIKAKCTNPANSTNSTFKVNESVNTSQTKKPNNDNPTIIIPITQNFHNNLPEKSIYAKSKTKTPGVEMLEIESNQIQENSLVTSDESVTPPDVHNSKKDLITSDEDIVATHENQNNTHRSMRPKSRNSGILDLRVRKKRHTRSDKVLDAGQNKSRSDQLSSRQVSVTQKDVGSKMTPSRMSSPDLLQHQKLIDEVPEHHNSYSNSSRHKPRNEKSIQRMSPNQGSSGQSSPVYNPLIERSKMSPNPGSSRQTQSIRKQVKEKSIQQMSSSEESSGQTSPIQEHSSSQISQNEILNSQTEQSNKSSDSLQLPTNYGNDFTNLNKNNNDDIILVASPTLSNNSQLFDFDDNIIETMDGFPMNKHGVIYDMSPKSGQKWADSIFKIQTNARTSDKTNKPSKRDKSLCKNQVATAADSYLRLENAIRERNRSHSTSRRKLYSKGESDKELNEELSPKSQPEKKNSHDSVLKQFKILKVRKSLTSKNYVHKHKKKTRKSFLRIGTIDQQLLNWEHEKSGHKKTETQDDNIFKVPQLPALRSEKKIRMNSIEYQGNSSSHNDDSDSYSESYDNGISTDQQIRSISEKRVSHIDRAHTQNRTQCNNSTMYKEKSRVTNIPKDCTQSDSSVDPDIKVKNSRIDFNKESNGACFVKLNRIEKVKGPNVSRLSLKKNKRHTSTDETDLSEKASKTDSIPSISSNSSIRKKSNKRREKSTKNSNDDPKENYDQEDNNSRIMSITSRLACNIDETNNQIISPQLDTNELDKDSEQIDGTSRVFKKRNQPKQEKKRNETKLQKKKNVTKLGKGKNESKNEEATTHSADNQTEPELRRSNRRRQRPIAYWKSDQYHYGDESQISYKDIDFKQRTKKRKPRLKTIQENLEEKKKMELSQKMAEDLFDKLKEISIHKQLPDPHVFPSNIDPVIDDCVPSTSKGITERSYMPPAAAADQMNQITTDSGHNTDSNAEENSDNNFLLHWLKNLVQTKTISSNPVLKKIFTMSNQVSIANSSTLVFREMDSVEYAYYHSDDEKSHNYGYMRFHPNGVKKSSRTKKFALRFLSLVGNLQLIVDDNTAMLKNGDFVTVPKGTRYGFKNKSNEPALLFYIRD